MAIVDKKTPRLGLLLPNADNFLQDDVERLIQSFDLLDVLVVMRDQTTGKIADDQLSEVIARLDAQGKIATSALPSSVVQKGADGKIDASVLPSIAIIDSFPVPNEASMLGLQCERGDIAIRTDLGRSFILTDLPPSKLSNWRELTSTNVTSVNGQVGAITGLAKAGVNDDITQLTALSGPLRLGGDGVGDYDAVTMRQLRSSSGGAGGPSMNGVMNYGVGDFHLRDSRAFIQPYEVVSDGQLLNRADWPELWAYAQMLTPISDAEWLGNPQVRGRYSTGDGTTTFRVPDRNGVQSGSIKALFSRGDGGDSASAGIVNDSAAPNIVGNYSMTSSTSVFESPGQARGAFYGVNNTLPYANLDQIKAAGSPTIYPEALGFDASRVSPVYGRYGITEELFPRSFSGVWVIRASGGFVAANTSWTVYNSDQTLPPANTTANGGVVRSEYQVGGSLRAAASFVAQHTTRTDGSPTASLQIGVSDGSNSATWWYKANGHITSSTGRFLFDGVLNPGGNVEIGAGEFCSFILEDKNSADADGVGKWWSWALDGHYGSYFIKRLRGGVNTGQIVINMPSSSGAIALQGTSGIDFKHDIKDADLTEAMDRIEAMRMVNFIYNDDEENRVRFGIIAEEAELIAPQYIKHNQEPYEDILDEDGNKIGEKTRDRPSVDVNPIVMDLMGCVQALNAKIAALDAEIAELKASK